MRSLFVCLVLGALAWLSNGAEPSAGPLVYLGLMIAVPALASRLTPIHGQFAHVGALAAGFLLGWTGLVSEPAFESIQPYLNVAAVWVGMHLSACLPVSLLHDRRLLLALFAAGACPFLLCFTGLTLLLALPAGSALLLALLSPISAPLFAQISQPGRKQAVWLSVLLTCAGLVLWLLLAGPAGLWTQSGTSTALMLLIWVMGMEALHRASEVVRSEPGHFLLSGAAALVLSIAASRSGVPALYLGLASGLMLAARTRRPPQCVTVTAPVATMLVPFVLAAFAARLPVALLSSSLSGLWPFLAVYTGCLVVGKLTGIILAGRLTSIPLRDWILTLPQGLPAGMLVLSGLPSHAMPPGGDAAVLAAALMGLCGIGLSLATWPLQILAIRRGTVRG